MEKLTNIQFSLMKLLICSFLFAQTHCKKTEPIQSEPIISPFPDKNKTDEELRERMEKEKRKEKLIYQRFQKFINTGYTILDVIEGDLNLDKYPDAILTLRKIEEDNYNVTRLEEIQMERPMLLLIGQEDKTYMLAAKNDNALRCLNCFGELGDYFSEMGIKKGFFGISENVGGGSFRGYSRYTFEYSRSKKNWYLLEIKEKVFGRYIEEEDKDYYKNKKDFGEVRFDKFITPFPF